MKILNVGCGATPIEGAINLDNSMSVIISKIDGLVYICEKLGLLSDIKKIFFKKCKEYKIEYGNAVKLRFPDNSIDVVYSSHVVEHLYERDLSKFIQEAYRVLKPEGILRIVLPDLRMLIERYNLDNDADAFCESLYMNSRKKTGVIKRMITLIIGDRGHKWMYDGESMKKYIEMHSKFNVVVLKAGESTIKVRTNINLYERDENSVYLECQK